MGEYKNFSVKLSILITVFIVISFSGCFSHWDGGEATLTIYLGGRGSRVIYTLDDGTMSRLYYALDFSGPSTFTIGPTEPGAESVSVTLFSGRWDITVTAYLDDGVYAIGRAVVEVRAGESVSTTITLDFAGEYTVAFNSITDFVEWLASQPANTAANPYIVKLSVSDLGGNVATAGSVGAILFANNTKYVTLDLSDSTITTIPEYAFYWYLRRNGITTLIRCETLTGIIIPDSVTSIGYKAFEDCTSLTSVTIPDSVTSIGASAFYGCTSLTSVTIGNSVTSIGEDTFACCSSLTSVTIGNSVTSIGAYAFEDCTSLTSITIPDSVTSIECGAFYGCTDLTNITIPNSVTSIGGWVFEDCTSLTSVTFDVGSDIKEDDFGDCAFPEGNEGDNGDNLKYSYLNGGARTYTRNANGDWWGNSMVTFTSIDDFRNWVYTRIPNNTNAPYNVKLNVSDLRGSSYYDLNSAGRVLWHYEDGNKYVNLDLSGSSFNAIGERAFDQCTLTSVIIGNSVTSIGLEAFSSCESLISVTIGNKVISIGQGAFLSCTSLTSIIIPESVISINMDAFADCTSLTNVTFQGEISTNNFGYVDTTIYSPFLGDLRAKYLAGGGGIGTYTTTAPVSNTSSWTKH